MSNFSMTNRVNNLKNYAPQSVPPTLRLEKIPKRRWKVITFPATPPTNPVLLTRSGFGTFSQSGARIFQPGFNYNGTGTVANTMNTPTLWRNAAGNSVDGPMNRTCIWSASNPLNVWVGFSTCFNIPVGESKTYYVGIAGDNHYRLVLDGTPLLETTAVGGGGGATYLYWNIYPVFLSEGEHILEIYGLNTNGPGGFGAEIYDNTAQQLVNATQLSNLNVIWTSATYTVATIVQDLNGTYLSSGYTCPVGAVYEECSGLCVIREYYYEPV